MLHLPYDPLSLFLICLSAASIGVSKGGMAGLATLALPLAAMVYPPVEAAAILVPLLVTQDIVAAWLYRRQWNRTIILWMLPASLAGAAIATLVAASVSAEFILALIGVVSILFGAWRLWLTWHKLPEKPLSRHEWPGGLFGFISGFVSQIALAGAPPFQMWVIPKKLPHLEFVGTSAIFFAVLNWAKVPGYLALGAFSRESLILSLWLLPVAMLFTWIGMWIVKHMRGQGFYAFINLMLAAIGVKLIFDALG